MKRFQNAVWSRAFVQSFTDSPTQQIRRYRFNAAAVVKIRICNYLFKLNTSFRQKLINDFIQPYYQIIIRFCVTYRTTRVTGVYFYKNNIVDLFRKILKQLCLLFSTKKNFLWKSFLKYFLSFNSAKLLLFDSNYTHRKLWKYIID